MMDILAAALAFFSEKIERFIELLTCDITTIQSGTVWFGIKIFFNAILSVGMSVAAILILINIIESTYKYTELKRPTVFFRMLLEIVIFYTLMSHILDVLILIYNFGTGIAKQALTAVGMLDADGNIMINITLSQEARDLYDWSKWYEQIGLGAVIIILSIWIVIATITVLLIVYGRIFNIFMLIAVSPLTFACSLSNATRRMFYGYLRTFFSVVLEALVIVAAIFIFKVFASALTPEFTLEPGMTLIPHWFSIEIVPYNTDGAGEAMIRYLFEIGFLFAVLMSVIRASETIVNRIFGI